jgi:hypothetical protein
MATAIRKNQEFFTDNAGESASRDGAPNAAFSHGEASRAKNLDPMLARAGFLESRDLKPMCLLARRLNAELAGVGGFG